MTNRPLRRMTSKPALRVEEIDEILERFRVDVAEVAEGLSATTTPSKAGKDGVEADLPDLSGRASAMLRTWLEDEVIALVEPEGPRGIDEHELHHEILKKALVTLKREVLQDIARSKKLIPETKLDDLARQVARAYQWNESAIAQLLLDYTEEPRETRGGFSTRLFSLRKPADVSRMAERLSYVDGRYYRTDIAKWFVFEQYRTVDSVLRVGGALQSYKAKVDPATDGKLATERDSAACELEVRAGATTVLVHQARSYSVARSMLAAFRVATEADVIDSAPNTGADSPVVPRQLHPSTLFLLDVLTHRMDGPLFRSRNAILARFRLGSRAASQGAATSSRKPTLRAVRFEGENLLDSPAACGLMWTEGRPLVDVTVSVLATEADQAIRARVPIRIALEGGAVLVETGLSDDPDVASEVHEAVTAHVVAAMQRPVSAENEALLQKVIKTQAETPDPDADARLLEDRVRQSTESSASS